MFPQRFADFWIVRAAYFALSICYILIDIYQASNTASAHLDYSHSFALQLWSGVPFIFMGQNSIIVYIG